MSGRLVGYRRAGWRWLLCVGVFGVLCCVGWSGLCSEVAFGLPTRVTVVVGTGGSGSKLVEGDPSRTQLRSPSGVLVDSRDGSFLARA